MLKKGLALAFAAFAFMNLCGCFAAMAMYAENSKAKKTLDISYSEAIDVVKGALKTTGVEFQRAEIKADTALVKGKYADGRTVRILISREGDNESLIAVRVGVSDAGKEEAEQILQAIVDYASLVADHFR